MKSLHTLGFLLCLLFLLFSNNVSAANQDSPGLPLSEDSSDTKKGFLGLPLFYYTPDTRFAFGGLGVYYFKIDGDSGNSTRLSYSKLLIDYTQNRQLDVWGSWNIFLKDEKFFLKGEVRYRNFPDKFYGIGNRTEDGEMERYDYNLVSFKKLVLRKVKPHLFMGADMQMIYTYKYHIESDRKLASGQVTGADGGLTSGLGLVSLYDSRDNVVYPMEGRFFEVSSYFYGGYLGSEFRYTNVNVTYNYYINVFKRAVIATNSVANFNFGNPSFIAMAFAGNDDILRGYARNRYRDHNFIGTQVEFRTPLFWRIGMACFAGVGDVFNQFDDVRFNTLKYSYGAGLRYTVNKKEHLNLRFDYGFGRGQSGFYIMIAEAF
ncbi:MAG: BamA/TamA family outer membrane protein [Cytophagaceae bacterium]